MSIQEKFDSLPPEIRTELVWAKSALNDAVAMLPVFAREATGERAKRFVEVMIDALHEDTPESDLMKRLEKTAEDIDRNIKSMESALGVGDPQDDPTPEPEGD